MNRWPETEPSLLRRLVDPANDQAWRRFDSLYRPAVYRYARQGGLAESDAEEVAVDVMRRVATAARRWSEQRPPRHFGAWLQRVARNSLLNLVTRELARRGTGGTSNLRRLSQRAEPTGDDHQRWQRQRQETLLRQAAKAMREQFDADTCDVFWRTHVHGQPIGEVAERFGKSAGAVYAIRSRLVRWLREEVERLEKLEAGDE